MSKLTFLSAIGHGLKVGFTDVFGWLGSSQGKKAVAGAEAAAAVIGTAVGGPALGVAIGGVTALVNSGLQSAATIESVAAQAGQQAGTGAQKAAAVTSVLTADTGAFLKSIGVSDATDAEVQGLASVIGSAAADILNAIPARAAAAPSAVAAPVNTLAAPVETAQ